MTDLFSSLVLQPPFKQVESLSIPGKFYTINLQDKSCNCPFFRYNKTGICPHLEAEGVVPTKEQKDYPFLALKANPTGPNSTALIQAYDLWLRTRVSKNFILRDFMFSAYGSVRGIQNIPEHPLMVEKAARELCAKVCEPILERFGPFSITYGYSSRELMQAEWPSLGPKQSSPHNWDRGTFGNSVYARIDILPLCVEDGLVTREQFAQWMMMNLDLDLLMQWDKSNVLCVTIGPKPRRVWLKWVQGGQGDGGTNKVTYMGEEYWQAQYPILPVAKRPKFGPSLTGGKMYWGG